MLDVTRPSPKAQPFKIFITENPDRFKRVHRCDNTIILGDLNLRGIQRCFNFLLDVFSLHNYVTFLTHQSGSTLDAVVTDLAPHEVRCSPPGPSWKLVSRGHPHEVGIQKAP